MCTCVCLGLPSLVAFHLEMTLGISISLFSHTPACSAPLLPFFLSPLTCFFFFPSPLQPSFPNLASSLSELLVLQWLVSWWSYSQLFYFWFLQDAPNQFSLNVNMQCLEWDGNCASTPSQILFNKSHCLFLRGGPRVMHPSPKRWPGISLKRLLTVLILSVSELW